MHVFLPKNYDEQVWCYKNTDLSFWMESNILPCSNNEHLTFRMVIIFLFGESFHLLLKKVGELQFERQPLVSTCFNLSRNTLHLHSTRTYYFISGNFWLLCIEKHCHIHIVTQFQHQLIFRVMLNFYFLYVIQFVCRINQSPLNFF